MFMDFFCVAKSVLKLKFHKAQNIQFIKLENKYTNSVLFDNSKDNKNYRYLCR